MILKQPLYLVPYDFTAVSETALVLAQGLADANNGAIYLLHVVKNHGDKKAIRTKFEDLMSKMDQKNQERTITKVIVGDLFEDMGKAGELLKADLIVMGTHGSRGMQKIFGSNAVKMISNASVPILIVQDGVEIKKIKDIVMPFSFTRESIQIVLFAGVIAKKFNARIHLVGYHATDEWHENKTKTNLNVVQRTLTENGIAFETVNLPGKESYEKELIAYAGQVNADLISAAYYKEGIMPSPNSFIQQMIENQNQIPVLTVNTEELAVINSQLSFLTV